MAAKKKVAKVPVREAARIVLLESGRPMHYREIAKVAVEQGIVKVRGKRRKPKLDATVKTVRSYLAGEAAREGEGQFVRVDPGVFDIRNRKKVEAAAKRAVAKAAKAEVKV